MSALYFTDIHGHDHELLQKSDGEFYYYNHRLDINVPLMFYDDQSNPVTNINDIKDMPRIHKKEKLWHMNQ